MNVMRALYACIEFEVCVVQVFFCFINSVFIVL